MQFYLDPTRENDEHALPDAEVFHSDDGYEARRLDLNLASDTERWWDDGSPLEPGFYWWPCFPGCLPDGDPIGPFETEEEAIQDARGES